MTTTHPVTPPALSYELFPPRNAEARAHAADVVAELEASRPDYVSVTYNGTPARRRASVEMIGHLIEHTRLRPLAHLTCVGETRESLDQLVNHLVALGVRGLLALRGDLPAAPAAALPHEDADTELPFARYLVELIREVEQRRAASLCAGRLSIGVAAYPTRHPESPSFRHDIEVLLAKERAGADFAITQIYFDPADYVNLVERARAAGVTIPIIPGVMPVTAVRRLLRLCELSGLEPDRKLLEQLENAVSDAERHKIGVDHAACLAQAAFDSGAPGLHLYTFNESRAPLDVVKTLGLTGAGTADVRNGAEYGDVHALANAVAHQRLAAATA